MAMLVSSPSLTLLIDGVDTEDIDVELLFREKEKRLVRVEKNDPMFEPHVPKAAFASTILGGRDGVAGAAAGIAVGDEMGELGSEFMVEVVEVDSTMASLGSF